MCYNVHYLRRKAKKYAEHHFLEFDETQFQIDYHYTNAFQHHFLPAVTDKESNKLIPLQWGLIPFWVKDEMGAKRISNQTPNAMGETVFEKPSFRDGIRNKRCYLYCDGFFEYHNVDSKTKVPYYITSKDGFVLFAGIWSEWTPKQTEALIRTCAIVTTRANATMAAIHNNPEVIKRTGSGRMPVILPEELANQWIIHDDDPYIDQQRIQDLIAPYPSDHLVYHTVAPLQGKKGTGNSKEATKPYDWNLIGLP